MFVKQFLTGGDRNFAYLAADENSREAVIIDPSYDPDAVIDYALKNHYRIQYAFNTHDHYDHTNGNLVVKSRLGIDPLTFADEPVYDQARISLGNLEIVIIHTTGHTDDSICLLIGDALFTGDTLFVGKIGGTDLGDQARKEYDSLHEKLM